MVYEPVPDDVQQRWNFSKGPAISKSLSGTGLTMGTEQLRTSSEGRMKGRDGKSQLFKQLLLLKVYVAKKATFPAALIP
jgi:hypothetical protein